MTYCGQTAGWIKMPLGMQANLSPGDAVTSGRNSPLKTAQPQPPVFGSCLLWANGWMDKDATWYRLDLGPGYVVLDGVPAPHESGTAAPLFSANVYCGHSYHLSYC